MDFPNNRIIYPPAIINDGVVESNFSIGSDRLTPDSMDTGAQFGDLGISLAIGVPTGITGSAIGLPSTSYRLYTESVSDGELGVPTLQYLQDITVPSLNPKEFDVIGEVYVVDEKHIDIPSINAVFDLEREMWNVTVLRDGTTDQVVWFPIEGVIYAESVYDFDMSYDSIVKFVTQVVIDNTDITSILDVATDGNGLWAVTGISASDGSSRVIYSNDFVTWEISDLLISSYQINAIGVDKSGTWICSDQHGNVYKSINGCANWNVVTGANVGAAYEIVWVPSFNAWLVLGYYSYYSYDGVTWATASATTGAWRTYSLSPTKIVIAGANAWFKTATDDPTVWVDSGIPRKSCEAGTYDADTGKYIFIDSDKQLHVSTDAINWTTTLISEFIDKPKLLFKQPTDGKYIVSDLSGNWYESLNLTNWTLITGGDYYGTGTSRNAATDNTDYLVGIDPATLLGSI